MMILAIDTSSRTGSIAYLCNDEVLAEISGTEETLYSTRLFRDLDALQHSAKFRLDQIDMFAVAAGPGSFTGLRVGLTAVKAWAEVHGKPIAAISGLEAIAAQSKTLTRDFVGDTGAIAPFLDARRGQVFGSVYLREPTGFSSQQPLGLTRLGLNMLEQESVFSAQDFLTVVKRTIHLGRPVLVSPTPEVIPAELITLEFPGVCVASVSPVLAPAIGLLGYERAMRGELVDALHLDANYVRRSDAESKWKDR